MNKLITALVLGSAAAFAPTRSMSVHVVRDAPIAHFGFLKVARPAPSIRAETVRRRIRAAPRTL